jgi:hypothetical protein
MIFMGFTKKETTLALATAVIVMLIGSTAIGIGTGFIYGDIKITQEMFNQTFQFSILFAGAALMYFGFRAGQSNGTSVTQS